MTKSDIPKIPYIDGLSQNSQPKTNEVLRSSGFHGNIDQVNWKAYTYKPKVSFYLAHDGKDLFILYEVNEKNIRAKYVEDNDAVWEDSCVEAFFLNKNNSDKGYFNFEFNCIGTALAGYGQQRDNRTHLGKNQMLSIKRASSLKRETIEKPGIDAEWWLQITIPMDIMGVQKEQILMANFYKCGDKCEQPHFLSWRPILTPAPNFHQPAFFGELMLE